LKFRYKVMSNANKYVYVSNKQDNQLSTVKQNYLDLDINKI